MANTKAVDMPIIEQIMEKSKYSKTDESYSIAKRGVAEFISEIVKSDNAEEKINKFALDEMIAHIDYLLSKQMDEVLHNEEFQKLESTWRGLRFLVERTDFNENIKIDLFDIRKEEALEDFENNPDITQSVVYKNIYSSEYGQFGGEPVGAIIGDYQLGSASPDMTFLNKMASIAAMSHSPFLTSFGPKFFGLDDYSELANIQDLQGLLEGPQYTRWRTFRENEDSKYTGLLVTRFLARSPYDPEENPIKSFNYKENVHASHNHLLWANSSYTFCTRLTESFAKYRWCGNIIGPKSGGTVKDLPTYLYENFGTIQSKIPTEVLITDRREYELAEAVYITLTLRRDSENGLNEWIRQYISDQENPPSEVRSRRPFRAAQVKVDDIPGEPGWYKIGLSVRPHFKYMGGNFELSLVGKLDKE
ncbi:type VI secretion system contractile sheath large subunit [Campylobacter jejuni]